MTLLNDAEWQKWSDREVARRTGVSDRFVNDIRTSLSANRSQIERTVERNGVQYTMNTANIGSAGHRQEALKAPHILSHTLHH